MSEFHKQVILYWKLIYKHNFSLHNSPIWNNRYILFRNKSLFIRDWWESGVWSVAHLLGKDGYFMDHSTFCGKYNILCDYKQYNKVLNCIPKAFVLLVSNTVPSITEVHHLPSLIINGQDFIRCSLPNILIRTLLTEDKFPNQASRNNVTKIFPKSSIFKLRTMYLSFPIPPKAKEVHFKNFNDIYPSLEFLRNRFNIDHNNCTFCDVDILYIYSLTVHSVEPFGMIHSSGLKFQSSCLLNFLKMI